MKFVLGFLCLSFVGATAFATIDYPLHRPAQISDALTIQQNAVVNLGNRLKNHSRSLKNCAVNRVSASLTEKEPGTLDPQAVATVVFNLQTEQGNFPVSVDSTQNYSQFLNPFTGVVITKFKGSLLEVKWKHKSNEILALKWNGVVCR